MKWLTAIGIVLLWSGFSLAAPQPYMPQPGDLSNKDQPSASTLRQVQNRSEAFKPVPASPQAPSGTPAASTASGRFQPQPYVPHLDDLPAPPPGSAAPPAMVPQPDTPAASSVSTPSPPGPTPTPVSDPKPAPVNPSLTAPAAPEESKAQISAVINQALLAYAAKDCPRLLALFHTQAYVLVRNPWGEQGSLGHRQLREAHCADVSNPKTPLLKLTASQVEIIGNDRAKAWGQLIAKANLQGQPVDIPASFEADLVKEQGAWLITDAIIQYDAP